MSIQNYIEGVAEWEASGKAKAVCFDCFPEELPEVIKEFSSMYEITTHEWKGIITVQLIPLRIYVT